MDATRMYPRLSVPAAALLMLLAGCSKPGGAPPQAARDTAQEAGPPRVRLSAEQLKLSGVELATAGSSKLRDLLPLYGVIAVNAERMREVVARYPGLIRSATRSVGDTVHQGDVLATVESNESLQTYSVTSPLTGVITARNANPGEHTSGKPLYVVVDLSTVWVELSLFARDAGRVRIGQKVVVQSPTSDSRATGRITYVGPLGSSSTQTLTARALLDNQDNRWVPGLYVSGDVILAELEVPLAVRESAVQRIADQPVIFVRTDQGFEARSVTLGRDDGDLVEIRSGLSPGDTYAATNSYVLKADALKGAAD